MTTISIMLRKVAVRSPSQSLTQDPGRPGANPSSDLARRPSSRRARSALPGGLLDNHLQGVLIDPVDVEDTELIL